jgi:hypothetical protein
MGTCFSCCRDRHNFIKNDNFKDAELSDSQIIDFIYTQPTQFSKKSLNTLSTTNNKNFNDILLHNNHQKIFTNPLIFSLTREQNEN